MLVAFARLVRERPAGAASVLMACTVDEEFTHTGSSFLARVPHGADLAIVSEPTRLELVDCHKGAVRWKVRVKGVACHSSTPHLGINAIYRMARVVSALAGHAADLAQARGTPGAGTAEPLGRPDRGGTERQRRARLVRDRSRPATPPRRDAGRSTGPGASRPAGPARRRGRRMDRVLAAFCQHAGPVSRRRVGRPLAGARRRRTGAGARPAAGRVGRSLRYGRRPARQRRDSPAWCSDRGTSPRPTPRTNGSSSSRSGSRPRRIIRSPWHSAPMKPNGLALILEGRAPSEPEPQWARTEPRRRSPEARLERLRRHRGRSDSPGRTSSCSSRARHGDAGTRGRGSHRRSCGSTAPGSEGQSVVRGGRDKTRRTAGCS